MRGIRIVLAIVILTLCAPGSSSAFAAGPNIVALRASGANQVVDVYTRRPQQIPPDGQPLQVVVALHGMGGNGPDFGAALASQADQYGWLIVAPTIRYGDWTKPDLIAREDPALIAWLSDEINTLTTTAEYPLNKQVLLFGHSRGAQLALRFTEIHPEQVAGVAAISAGTYTLPVTRDSRNRTLEFPFGVANLAQDDGGKPFNPGEFREVPIWVGVGADDNNPNDVPDAWDPYIGDDRRERAERFASTLSNMGADVTLNVFDGASHGLTDDMRAAGCKALARSNDGG
jgi:pimeloyl-ACP methyl ester carboxylesterase